MAISKGRKEVRCITTGKGSKGAVFVCSSPSGDVVVHARKVAPYKYRITATLRRKHLETTIYSPTIRTLRRRVEDWVKYKLGL